jgi:hypothetical protein
MLPALSSRILALSTVIASALSIVACSAPAEDETPGSDAAQALSADSLGIACRTLGELGQCAATSLCKTASEASCKAKASALATDPSWATQCNRTGSQQACGWLSSYCTWDETSLCVPRSGKPSVGAPDVAATCSALGELGACGRVPACKSSVEGVCRATDDAVAADPQWQQMCPRSGTSQEACEVQSNCTWENVNTCTPRATASAPLDVGTACRTLGESGACGLVPSICKTLTESQCVAKASALASDPKWERQCMGTGNEQACGWLSSYCDWQPVDECVPLAGPRPGSAVDLAKACDTFGQVGVCSRTPICKPVVTGTCRATANALAGDPDWAQQCPRAGTSPDTCGWLAPNCTWDTSTSCVPN